MTGVNMNDTERPEPAADAVEHHPMQGEVWSIIRRAMDTPYRARFERDAIGSEAARKVIAALESVLLSDEVVEAAAKGMMFQMIDDDEWDEAHPNMRDLYRGMAKAALQAALAAAKGMH